MAEQVVARAALLVEAGRTGEAIQLLRSHLGQAPDDFDALSTLADAYLVDDQPEPALRTAHQMLGSVPDSPAALAVCVSAHLQLNRGFGDEHADSALSAARRLVEVEPHVAGAHMLLAAAYGQFSGMQNAVLASATKAVELDPLSAHNTYSLGLAHANNDSWSQAALWFERTLELDPWHAGALHWLQMRGKHGTFAGPRIFEAMMPVLAIRPTDATAQANLWRGFSWHAGQVSVALLVSACIELMLVAYGFSSGALWLGGVAVGLALIWCAYVILRTPPAVRGFLARGAKTRWVRMLLAVAGLVLGFGCASIAPFMDGVRDSPLVVTLWGILFGFFFWLLVDSMERRKRNRGLQPG